MTISLLQELSAEQAAFRPTPTDWSVKEVIGHLCDCERIFNSRALHIARADLAPLAGFEPQPYVVSAEADARPLAELLAEFAAVRQSTIRAVSQLAGGLGPARYRQWGAGKRACPGLHHCRTREPSCAEPQGRVP